ncbi:hypothetical protein [Novosphingobium sp.]|uniref:hypothetical protein n=1 Tax=Novosphingobium sp. TaxID=1874826 RepID=UPI002612834E|nr:hypothetical protein [Novosphingobium sp.]
MSGNSKPATANETMLAALQEIAASADVPLDRLPDADQPNGWRQIAVDRITIARETLARLGVKLDER